MSVERYLIEWSGVTQSRTYAKGYAKRQNKLVDEARRYNWEKVFGILNSNDIEINSWRLDSEAFDTPLHHAAYGNAPVDIVEKLMALGAWRTLRNAKGERPIDIAEQRGHLNLVNILKPVYKHQVPFDLEKGVGSLFLSHSCSPPGIPQRRASVHPDGRTRRIRISTAP